MPADPGDAGPQQRCAVLGSPISHSRSPALHRAAYAALGLPWQYDAREVTADQLPEFVRGLGVEWRGLSLTMPLKLAAGVLCATVEPAAAQVGAVNTMVRGEDRQWCGYNTDIGGCVDALRAAGVDRVDSAVIVGAGATARSALAAVADLGARRAQVLARSVERAGGLVTLGRELGVEVAVSRLGDPGRQDPVDVLVSTIPAAAQNTYAAEVAGRAPVILDVVYDPPLTPLLLAAQRRGAVGIPGLELLLHQAGRQVVLMTGVADAPVEAMRDVLR